MGSSRPLPQPILPADLRAGALVDAAFVLVRRLPRGTILPQAAFLVLASGLVASLAAVGWHRDPAPAPGLLRFVALSRFLLAALEVGLGMDLARRAWRHLRGPLDPAPPLGRILPGAVMLAAILAALTFAPVVLLLGGALREGRITLLAGEWLADGRYLLASLLSLAFLPALLLAPAVLAVEGGSAVRALWRSLRLALTPGRRAYTVTCVVWLMRGAISVGLALLVVGQDAFVSDADPEPARVALGCTALVVQALLALPAQAAWFLAWLDARIRTEGLDVEYEGRLAGLLAPEGAP